VDFDGDGLDEILTSESSYGVHGYRGDGTPLAGFPAYFGSGGGQTAAAPLVADLDNDGRPEFVSTSDSSAGGVIGAWHADGTRVRGFPIMTPEELDAVGAGDVDGDGSEELVFLTYDVAWTFHVDVFGGDGTLERSWSIPNTQLGAHTSGILADMNQDGIPEIVVASRDPNHPPYRFAVYDGLGNLLPGWPVDISANPQGGGFYASSMVAGDLDGDRKADLFFANGDSMYVLRNDGSIAPGFPISNGDELDDIVYPAMADLDRDGRNEVIVHTDRWRGDYGYYRGIFVYDFGMGAAHGPVEWGMEHGDARRTAHYETGKNLAADAYVAVQSRGPGTITSVPAGISCGTSCLRRVAKGTQLTLTATPAAGEVFYGWRGACANTIGSCVVSVSDYTAVAADFRSQSITATVVGNGTVSSMPAGIDCPGTCSKTLAADSLVVLTATPASDSEFVSWSGHCSGTGSCSVTLDQAKSVTATFRLKPLVTVALAGNGHATPTSTPAGIDCGAACSARFPTDTIVSINAGVASDTELVNWSGECSNAWEPHCVLRADGAKSVTLNLRLKPELTISRAGTGDGTITSVPTGIDCGSDCSEFIKTDELVLLTATPAANSTFAGWTGACSGTQLKCWVKMDVAKSAAATFTANSTGGSGSGSGSGNGKGGGGSLDVLALLFLGTLWLQQRAFRSR
jgi:hypothetical protein